MPCSQTSQWLRRDQTPSLMPWRAIAPGPPPGGPHMRKLSGAICGKMPFFPRESKRFFTGSGP